MPQISRNQFTANNNTGSEPRLGNNPRQARNNPGAAPSKNNGFSMDTTWGAALITQPTIINANDTAGIMKAMSDTSKVMQAWADQSSISAYPDVENKTRATKREQNSIGRLAQITQDDTNPFNRDGSRREIFIDEGSMGGEFLEQFQVLQSQIAYERELEMYRLDNSRRNFGNSVDTAGQIGRGIRDIEVPRGIYVDAPGNEAQSGPGFRTGRYGTTQERDPNTVLDLYGLEGRTGFKPRIITVDQFNRERTQQNVRWESAGNSQAASRSNRGMSPVQQPSQSAGPQAGRNNNFSASSPRAFETSPRVPAQPPVEAAIPRR